MKRNFAILILFMVLCLFVNESYAALINTGTNSNPDLNHQSISNINPFEQSLAVEFNLSESAVITGVTSVMKRSNTFATGDNYVRVSLWSDGGDVPDSPLGAGYEAEFLVNNTSWGGPGADGLSWYVSAGVDYWLVFDGVGESIDTTYIASAAPGPAVLNNAVYRRSWTATDGFGDFLPWQPADYDLSVFVTGNPVPVPAAVWLLGSGLIGIVGIRKKFKK